MCGIAGWLGHLPDSKTHAGGMVQSLHHRGPDGHGIQSWSEATLVHTRLSIIDLSSAGAQPMANEDGTVWTVFNGELYNHRELRSDLKARGHVFRGRSDTEVLTHLYEEEGRCFAEKLRGMFALAIYDKKSQTLILVRDRFGIKPLFYAPGSERFAFSSEIRALLAFPGIDLRPNRQAVCDFAALFYMIAPETFYRGIRALEPGEMVEARLEHHRISWRARPYHRWVIAPDPSLTLAQAADRTEELMTTAVHRQQESDVPLGALLSGGIDSSLISVAAQSAQKGKLQTFNMRFPDKDFDETWAAVEVAKQIASDHRILDMEDVPATWEHLTGLLLHAGQPFADTSLFAVNAVSKLMRKHVTVALSGDGGDEGFGGYNFYWRIAQLVRWQKLPELFWHGASVALGPLARAGFAPERLPQRLSDLAGTDNASFVQNLFCWVRQQELRFLCHDTDILPITRLFEPQWEHHLPNGTSRLERLSAQATEANIRLSLANDYLFKVDTASMKESLEIRVPMLDEDLFTFALSLPYSLKVKRRTCKRVLRTIAQRQLPHRVANKPKWGFAIPMDVWADGDFKVRMRETLLGSSSRLDEFFRPEAYRPIVEAFCEGRPCFGISRQGLYHRAIMFLSIQLALDRNIP